MRRVGIWCVVFGLLGLLLPRFGYDLRWFEFLGRARLPTEAGLVVLGLALLFAGARGRARDG